MTDTHGTYQRASVRQTVERQTEALRAEYRVLLASTGAQAQVTAPGPHLGSWRPLAYGTVVVLALVVVVVLLAWRW